MIRYSKLPENILSLIPEAVIYLRARKDVSFAYLFGSMAKGRKLPLSDIDIAVYLSGDLGLGMKKLKILGGLTECLKTDEVDLVLLNNAPITLRRKILENSKVIIDKDPFLRHKYESLTIREYFDFSILEKSMLERRFLHG